VRFRRPDGTFAGTGQHGLIEVRSAAMAQGYYRQPIESTQKFRGGWCLTGDIGFIDENINLHVLGRAADVAEFDGKAFGPAQIESPLCALPQVRYARAVSTGDAACRYKWNVIVVPWSGMRIDIGDCMRVLEAACGAKVANAVRMVATQRVPLTEQGKVDRARIGQMFEDEANRRAA
jgi:fatty-acyl-CoA synthase